ncbi:hypothetical protein ACFYU5_19265 [Nocardia aobensis]|uniref:Secreted protein n=1 Tax=Nocardia aobensis TaxID=257277 RepID=A0ABW6P608_9NOCA
MKRKYALIAAVAAALAFGGVNASVQAQGLAASDTGTDPCMFGEPEDQTYFADGTPAPALPCPLAVIVWGVR